MAAVDTSSTGVASSCRKVPRDENAGFMGNLKLRFNDFTNASLKEHKECFSEIFHARMYKTKECWKSTNGKVFKSWEKIIGRESEVTSAGENSATTLQPASRN